MTSNLNSKYKKKKFKTYLFIVFKKCFFFKKNIENIFDFFNCVKHRKHKKKLNLDNKNKF